MNLKIMLPSGMFTAQGAVSRLVVETEAGSMGVLPNRLDCAAALVPGILVYVTAATVSYVALDTGVLVKTGAEVLISVRRAVAGAGLAELQATLRRSYLVRDQRRQDVQAALAKMEAGMMGRFARLRHER